MKYLVKDSDNNILPLDVVSALPNLPQGWVVLGRDADLNPDNLDIDKCSFIDGLLVEDDEKILSIRQDKAEANLNELRVMRNALLITADHDINELEDNGQSATALRAYRKALRECTDSLKNEDGSASLSLENLILSEFAFPTKPE